LLKIRVKVKYVNSSDELNINELKNDIEYGSEYRDSIFIGENKEIIVGNNDKYVVGRDVEKMSKSKLNVVDSRPNLYTIMVPIVYVCTKCF